MTRMFPLALIGMTPFGYMENPFEFGRKHRREKAQKSQKREARRGNHANSFVLFAPFSRLVFSYVEPTFDTAESRLSFAGEIEIVPY